MALTEKQKQLRAKGYGASEVAALVGLSFKTPIDVYRDKVLGLVEEPEDENLAAEFGDMLEEPTAKVYAKRTGKFLARVHTQQHPTKPLAIATPDRAAFLTAVARGDPRRKVEDLGAEPVERLVEVKTTASANRRDYGTPGTDEVPEEKVIQCIWQMGVARGRGSDVLCVDLPVLFRGEWGIQILDFSVQWNEAVFEGLYDTVAKFDRDHVQAKKPPPADASDAYLAFLSRAFPTHREGFVMKATPEQEQLMLRYALGRQIADRAEAYKKRIAAALRATIGDAEGIESETLGRITYKRTKDSTSVNWQGIAEDALRQLGLLIQMMPDDMRPTWEAEYRALRPRHTKPRAGYRALRTYFTKDSKAEQVERQQLAMTLPPEPKKKKGKKTDDTQQQFTSSTQPENDE